MLRIYKNQVHCLKCDTVIESTHRHDFKFCPCGNIAVDGGREYLRRVGDVRSEKAKDITEYYDTETGEVFNYNDHASIIRAYRDKEREEHLKYLATPPWKV